MQKTGMFNCNIIAHQIAGSDVTNTELPNEVFLERQFGLMPLAACVQPDASMRYLESKGRSDRAGFNHCIDLLNRANRAGQAVENERRFMFIPPCDYIRTKIRYYGQSLIGVFQNSNSLPIFDPHKQLQF